MEASGGIDYHHVPHVALCVLYGLLRCNDGILRALFKHRQVELFAHYLQLLYGGRPVNVAGYQQRRLSEVLLAVRPQFTRHGGLARALKAGEQYHRRILRAELQLGV